MNEEDIKNMLYGSIRELTRDQKYFYGGVFKSEFTERGKETINKMLDMYAPVIMEAIKATDLARSKELVMKTLKESDSK